MKKVLLALVFIGILVGCSDTADPVTDEAWEVTPTFTVEGEEREIVFRGFKNEVAFMDGMDFTKGEEYKTRWFFWGEELEEVNKGSFTLVGNHQETGEEVTLVESTAWELLNPTYKETATKTILGAQSSQHTVFSLPTAGLWRLDAYIGDKLYGNIVIDVKEG